MTKVDMTHGDGASRCIQRLDLPRVFMRWEYDKNSELYRLNEGRKFNIHVFSSSLCNIKIKGDLSIVFRFNTEIETCQWKTKYIACITDSYLISTSQCHSITPSYVALSEADSLSKHVAWSHISLLKHKIWDSLHITETVISLEWHLHVR